MERFVEYWGGFAIATVLVELANHGGQVSWSAFGRAVAGGLLFAVLMTLYHRWRDRGRVVLEDDDAARVTAARDPRLHAPPDPGERGVPRPAAEDRRPD